MKAAVVTEQGVQYKDAPKPSPKANEILIKVKAASLNRADLAVASGHRHGTVGGAGTIVGLECAGEVEAVGGEVKDFKLRRVRRHRLGPRPQDPRQQHEL
jgi:NADPH2:quinone reductase